MASKLKAARRAAEAGASCVIANGTRPGALRAVLTGEAIGTYVHPAARSRGRRRPPPARRAAIERSGKSLLPSGVREVTGAFAAGEPVEIRDEAGPFARGLAGYSSDEIRRILGKKTSEIEQALGYKVMDEVVHRDDLALLGTK
jgi:glutamate 5-kinase